MNCPKCKEPMKNLGNTSGKVLLTNPPKWIDTYICEACKLKKDVEVRGTLPHTDISDYEDISE